MRLVRLIRSPSDTERRVRALAPTSDPSVRVPALVRRVRLICTRPATGGWDVQVSNARGCTHRRSASSSHPRGRVHGAPAHGWAGTDGGVRGRVGCTHVRLIRAPSDTERRVRALAPHVRPSCTRPRARSPRPAHLYPPSHGRVRCTDLERPWLHAPAVRIQLSSAQASPRCTYPWLGGYRRRRKQLRNPAAM